MTPFDLADGTTLLRRTPALLDAWLRDLPDPWLRCDEGPDTWNALEVLAHLVEAELHDWLPRTRHVLQHGEALPFPPFDRFSQRSKPARSAAQLLDEFASRRAASLDELASLRLSPADLQRRSRHPEFGVVTLGQHLATWVAHDLTHVSQVTRVMARRLAAHVGPWRAYLRVVRDVP